jgi:hypothetical protein
MDRRSENGQTGLTGWTEGLTGFLLVVQPSPATHETADGAGKTVGPQIPPIHTD